MSVKIVIKPNTYFDSVSLMSISARANKLDGVEQAFVAMATEMNKGVLKNLGLLTPELEQAKNGDLMIVINGKAGKALRDRAFGERFFGIWLGNSTSEPALRQALLGRKAPLQSRPEASSATARSGCRWRSLPYPCMCSGQMWRRARGHCHWA